MTGDLWPTYVINLADNTVRMENSRRQLYEQQIPFERIDAVLGNALGPDEIASVYDRRANSKRAKQDLVPGEIGCYLSHVAAWEEIAGTDAAGGIVLEDDFAASPDLRLVLQALGSDLHRDWDIAKLFSLDADPAVLSRRELAGPYALVAPYRVPSTTLGYAISREAARHLLRTAIPFFRPIDEDHKFIWEHGLRIALVQPNPLRVGEQSALTGTIGDARRDHSKGGAWRKLRYQLSYQARLRWHRMGGRA